MSATEHVIRDLAGVLADLRPLDDPETAAAAVLDRDSQVFSLVGLVDDGRRVVYYDWPIWTVRIAPVQGQGRGVGGLTARDSVARHHYGRVETYIEERGPDHWDWLHPRYRWVFTDRSGGPVQANASSNTG